MPPASLPSYIKSSHKVRPRSSFTFSSSPPRNRELWRFLKTFGKLVAIPSLIAVLFVELLAWRTGATVTASVAAIAELQHEDPNIIWGSPSAQLYGPLALARIRIERPEIVMIGHSRCAQMRSMMYKPYSFHNACAVAWTFGQIKNVIDLATRSGGPKTIIFPLDYFMFGDAYAKHWEEKSFMDFASPQRRRRAGLLELAGAFNRHPDTMLERMPSYLFGRARDPADDLELFAPYAIALRVGFRSDGSLLYPSSMLSQGVINNNDVDSTIATVADGDGVRPSPAQMQALGEIGELGRQRHLTLVGIQLPLFEGVVEILDSDKDWSGHRSADRGNWRLLQSVEMRQKLKAMGINFFNLTDDPVAKEPHAFIDSAHPSEYATGQALLDGMNNDAEFRSLFPRLDLAALQETLETARQQRRFYDVYRKQF